MYRMSIIAMMVPNKDINLDKCIKIALIHDIAESLGRNITPLVGCPTGKSIVVNSPPSIFGLHYLPYNEQFTKEMVELWMDYEEIRCIEARYVERISISMKWSTSMGLRARVWCQIRPQRVLQVSWRHCDGRSWIIVMKWFVQELSSSRRCIRCTARIPLVWRFCNANLICQPATNEAEPPATNQFSVLLGGVSSMIKMASRK